MCNTSGCDGHWLALRGRVQLSCVDSAAGRIIRSCLELNCCLAAFAYRLGRIGP